jgi:uncharacterized protein (TIGR03435 family)
MWKGENRRAPTLLVATALILISARLAPCQCAIGLTGATPVMASPSEQVPAYEVATIKPWDGKGFAMPLRSYIQRAFGISPNIAGRVIGPDWIKTERYVIQGKLPDTIASAMQSMTTEERTKETLLMMQSLLADRFQLKAHFETREMPVYELEVAKGGSKLKEDTDATKRRFAVGGSTIRATAAPITVISNALECAPDVDGREVVDRTGLTGTYDFSLSWTPLQAAAASADGNGNLLPADAGGASLFAAIVEQLGLKLVPAKRSAQVLVIDHIEQPSPN